MWNPKTEKTFMSRSVVFNESVIFNDSLCTDLISDNFDKEQQHISRQVELMEMEDQENKIVDDEAHETVQQPSPVLQQDDQPIAHRKSKRSCGPPVHYIEECNMTYYALSCAEQVENTHELATYSEAVDSGDREKWISVMQEEM